MKDNVRFIHLDQTHPDDSMHVWELIVELGASVLLSFLLYTGLIVILA